MSEFYSNGERVLIFGIIIAVSFIITLIYLCCRIDRKNISWFIFIICWLSSSLFIFLNIIAMFDIVFNNHQGFEKFAKFISKFYNIYDYIDKALGFLIFPLIISFLESGGFSIWRRLLDAFLGVIKEFIESLILSFKILILIAMLIILIKYRKHFGLGNNPIDYLFVILDCYAIVDIYICVGFFMVQIFIDCKRKSKKDLSERYYRYSIIKIIDQTDKDIDGMQTLYESLNKNMEKYQKEKSPSDLDNIKNLIKKIEVIINQYRLEANKVNNNNISNVNSTTNIYNNNNQDNIVDNINNANLYNVNKNTKPDNKDFRPETFNALKVNEKKIPNVGIKENNNEDPVECNTKFQEYERRIDRSRKLFKEFNKDNIKVNEVKQSTKEKKSKCTCYDIILFIAFFIVFMTDFFLPIVLRDEDNYIEDGDSDKEKSLFALGISVLLSCVVSIVCNAYTIITMYSTKRKRYITGDYLYGRKINDSLNLLKTVQLITGFSFALTYCNLYYWRAIDRNNVLGIPLFYDKVIIPDYDLKYNITVYMFIKVVIIIVSMIFAFISCNKISVFKNDLAEYNQTNLCCNKGKYIDKEFENIKSEKKKIFNFLKSEN